MSSFVVSSCRGKFNRRFMRSRRVFHSHNRLKNQTEYEQMTNDSQFFPTKITDLDEGRAFCIMSDELDSDPTHPGFNDPEYKKRRNYIAEIARNWSIGEDIPIVEYSNIEHETWSKIYKKLVTLYGTHACKQYNTIFSQLKEDVNMKQDNIPQLQHVSNFLKKKTGFTLAPVTGLLAPRYFLNALAFRVFNSTQYIRHHSVPEYTPEPDIVHELMGHIPLLADPDFAEFTQTLGLASLGATEEDIERLSRCYWFTVEFGLVKQNKQLKAVGAGLLSSYGELQYCLSDKPEVLPFDPDVASNKSYPITKYQPTYFAASSFKDMTRQMEDFSKTLERPFDVKFNYDTWTVEKIPKKSK